MQRRIYLSYNTILSSEFSSFVTEFDLVCDNASKNIATKVVYFMGFLVGAIVGGYLSDNVGRKMTCILALSGMFLFSVAAYFSTQWWHYFICRFLLGLFCNVGFIAGYCLTMETIGNSKIRMWASINYQLGFCCGIAILSGYGYFLRDWRLLQLGFGIPALPSIVVVYLLIPESMSYLISKGHTGKAKLVAATIMVRNGDRTDSKLVNKELEFIDYLKTDGDQTNTRSVRDLFTHSREMSYITVNWCLQWFVTSLIFYGISLGVGTMSVDIYTSNAMSGLISIPSYILTSWLATKKNGLGRRPLLALLLLLSASCCLLSTLFNELAACDLKSENRFQNPLVLIGFSCAMMGKFFIASSFAMIYVYTAELYPTEVRGNAVGLGSSFARVGAGLSPVVLEMYKWKQWSPGLAFGTLGLLAAWLVLKLPETQNYPLPLTYKDADMIHKQSSIEEASSLK